MTHNQAYTEFLNTTFYLQKMPYKYTDLPRKTKKEVKKWALHTLIYSKISKTFAYK